jgi:hypothetical protein
MNGLSAEVGRALAGATGAGGEATDALATALGDESGSASF